MKKIGSEYIVTHLRLISQRMAKIRGRMFRFDKILRVFVFQLNKKARSVLRNGLFSGMRPFSILIKVLKSGPFTFK